MSKKWMLKTLINLGFSKAESQVCVFLITDKPKNTKEIAEALQMNRNQLYRCLKRLQRKGFVKVSQGFPTCFSSVPFEEVLDILKNARIEQEKRLQESRNELLSIWRSITKKKRK